MWVQRPVRVSGWVRCVLSLSLYKFFRYIFAFPIRSVLAPHLSLCLVTQCNLQADVDKASYFMSSLQDVSNISNGAIIQSSLGGNEGEGDINATVVAGVSQEGTDKQAGSCHPRVWSTSCTYSNLSYPTSTASTDPGYAEPTFVSISPDLQRPSHSSAGCVKSVIRTLRNVISLTPLVSLFDSLYISILFLSRHTIFPSRRQGKLFLECTQDSGGPISRCVRKCWRPQLQLSGRVYWRQ